MKDAQLVNISRRVNPKSHSYRSVSASGLRQKDTVSCQKEKAGKFRRKKLIYEKLHQDESLEQQPGNEFQNGQSSSARFKDAERDSRVCRTQRSKGRRGHKRKKEKVVQDEAARLERRARYLLVKMKLEQNLIDAYSGEGWKGQSREKIRPEKELQRANKQILYRKLGLRDIVRQLDTLSSVGQIEKSVIDPDGSVHHDHIYCAKCKLQEVAEDNDIILCDGTCDCAFHQKCLDPPLATENIPPEDQGWLCKYCECKMEILDAMNAHLGTQFSATDSWKDIFKEEALQPDHETTALHPEEEWPDDESEDDDYDPSDEENSCRVTIEGYTSDECRNSSSLSCSLVSESGWFTEHERAFENNSTVDLFLFRDSDEHDSHVIISGPRRRYAVDYRKLYDEMFGNDVAHSEQLSEEDEDWGPPRKQKREKESDTTNTLMGVCESEKRHLDMQVAQVDGKILPNSIPSKSMSRMSEDAVKKLRQVFAENELPCREVKWNISQQLGLQFDKVDKWFKNARYLALKARKDAMEPSDNVSLSKHLMHLEAKDRENETPSFDTECQAQAETQMERICQIDSKLRELKNILRNYQSTRSEVANVIYIPVAELKEKTELKFQNLQAAGFEDDDSRAERTNQIISRG